MDRVLYAGTPQQKTIVADRTGFARRIAAAKPFAAGRVGADPAFARDVASLFARFR